MHFIIRGSRDKLPTDPAERRAAVEGWEQADSLKLTDAAKLRRDLMKHKRLANAAERFDLEAQAIAKMRAIRRNMEKRING